MRIIAVSDDRDTLTGLRLAGIEGIFAENTKDIAAAIRQARDDKSCAMLLITDSCAEKVPEPVKELKLSATPPLLVTIPSATGRRSSSESITDLIAEAIGVKL